jgi:hypothetical protein
MLGFRTPVTGALLARRYPIQTPSAIITIGEVGNT